MKLNHRNPGKVAFLDFETQSMAELTTVHKYASDSTTRALTCCVKVDGVMHKFGPYFDDVDKERLLTVTEGCTIVAHNASFDAAIWEKVLGLPEREWFDTLPCARAAGMPGKLDLVSKIVTGRGKDPLGKQLIDMLCILRNGRVPAIGPAHGLLLDYNQRDVEELEAIYERVKGYGEPDVIAVDRIINDRGIPVDVDYLEAMREVYVENAKIAEKSFEEITDGVNPKSSKQVKDWLLKLGFTVTNVSKNTLRDLIAQPDKFFDADGDSELADAVTVAAEAIAMRQEIVKVGAGKVKAALEAVEPDGRIRDQLVIYGAGPGRWAGRDLQIHNMPLAVKDLFVRDEWPSPKRVNELAAQASEKLGRKVAVADVANSMLRHAIRCDNMVIADYNAVEARCAAWLSECQPMLAIYNDPIGKSIYLDMGAKVFGRPIGKHEVREYALAKSLVLGCMYGMSAPKFEWTMQHRAKISLSDIAAVGLTAKDLVRIYRESYPEIPAMWRALGDAFMDCAEFGIDAQVGRLYICKVGNDMHMVLPSGRPIVYRNVRVTMAIPRWQKMFGMVECPVKTVAYDHPRGYESILYGSKAFENACQGTCRDLMANALVNFESVQLNPIFHVHDEGANEAPDSRFPEFMEIMSAQPRWADGFPIMVEGYSGPIWTKTPKGYNEATYFNGRRLPR